MGQKFSEASDVWSFGITCCEVFTGGDNAWGTVPNFTVMELIKAGVQYAQPDLCPNMFYDRVLVVRLSHTTAAGVPTRIPPAHRHGVSCAFLPAVPFVVC